MCKKKKIGVSGLESFFNIIIIPDELGREYWKPDKRCYIKILRELGLQAGEVAAIGDAKIDFIAPAELGMQKIFIEREDSLHDKISDHIIDKRISSLKEIEEGL